MGTGLIPRYWAAPPGLYGGYGGQEEDPLAAFIGKGLQAFGQVRNARQQEADRQQMLARQDAQERDQANWRNFTGRLEAYKEGLTTEPPPPGPTPAQAPDSTTSMGGQEPATPATMPQAVLRDPSGTPFYRDVGRNLAHYQPVHGASGPVGAFDPVTGTIKPTDFTIPQAPPRAGAINPNDRITPKQRESAGNGIAMQSAHQDLTLIENTDPQAIAEVARWVAAPSVGRLVPGIGTGVENVLRQARSSGLSDKAFQYLKRMFDFSSLAGPARYGRRFGSEIALQQIWNDFGAGQIGIGAGGVGATQRNRLNAVRAIRTAAGEPAWAAGQQVPTGAPAGPPNTRTTYRPDNPFRQP